MLSTVWVVYDIERIHHSNTAVELLLVGILTDNVYHERAKNNEPAPAAVGRASGDQRRRRLLLRRVVFRPHFVGHSGDSSVVPVMSKAAAPTSTSRSGWSRSRAPVGPHAVYTAVVPFTHVPGSERPATEAAVVVVAAFFNKTADC